MPKQRSLFVDIPKLYRRQAIDLIMYGYVHGLKKAMPSLSMDECIELFKEENGIGEDDLALGTAVSTIKRMRLEYMENRMELK